MQYFKNKIKQLYKRYFWVAFGTYWVLYGGGFVVIFGALYTGLVDPGVSWTMIYLCIAHQDIDFRMFYAFNSCVGAHRVASGLSWS